MAAEVGRRMMAVAFVLMWLFAAAARGQENAQTRIPDSLIECYTNPEIYERDNRLPATMNTLIDLIRKVEDAPGYSQDIRQVATSLLHRFKQDGIERAPGVYQKTVLPFSPSGYQFSKHRLLLSRLIPGNANSFPNNSLTVNERCSLHFLMSSSIETQIRGDEATRCGQLAQFRAMRVEIDPDHQSHRFSRSMSTRSNYLGNVRMVDEVADWRVKQRKETNKDRYSAIGYDPDYDLSDYDEEPVTESGQGAFRHDGLIDVASNAVSQCPVENGVVRTQWGAVSAGTLLSGIAAGLVQQNVGTRELLLLSRPNARGRHYGRQQVQLSIDNRWAATLAGDLAEVALLQGPISSEIKVGASGAWNSTTAPHWYFLSQRERLEMTDAEIRGGIDGLVIAMHIQEWRNQASQLKLSQVLEMYYSQRGVFTSKYKACNRKELFAEVAPAAQLQAQATACTTVLDREIQLRVTLSTDAIRTFSNTAAQALTSYVANGLNDVTCDATGISSPTVRVATNIHIFIDFSWQFNEVQPAIAAVLEQLDVGTYGSQFALYSANDGSVIVNTTRSKGEFYGNWNVTNHQQQTGGLNLPNILKQLDLVGRRQLDDEKSRGSVGGQSDVVLIVPQMAGVNEADGNYAVEQIVSMREVLPDLTLLFWSAGSHGRFARFVRDQQRDIFPLMATSSSSDSSQQVQAYAQPVIQRIQSVPRRIINPRCSSKWDQSDSGSNSMEQYVEPAAINYYRLQSNYFFKSGDKVRIQGRGYSQIAVCTSRSVEQPRYSNTSQPENVNCRQLLPSDNFEVELSNACEGHYLIQDCPPLFVSVEGMLVPAGQGSRCSEPECRSPDSIKFGVTVDNLGCYSAANALTFMTFLLLISSALLVNFQ